MKRIAIIGTGIAGLGCAHFLHDVSAMKFDGSLGGGELAGNFFVKEPGGNQGQHFALARRELFVTLAQIGKFRPAFAGFPIAVKRSENNV